MKDVPKGTAADAVREAMDRAACYVDNPLDQYDRAEVVLYGQPRALALLKQLRTTWLLNQCNAVGNAPVRYDRPRRGWRP